MSEGDDLRGNLYKENFNPNAAEGDLERAHLDKKVDLRQENLRSLKASLEDWRTISLPLMQFLEWQRPWYPAVLLGVNTVFFVMIWYLNLSVLSTLAVLGTILAFADGIIPVLSTTILPITWTDEHERQFGALCNRLMDCKQYCHDLCSNMHRLKTQLPRFFSLGLCGVFIILAVIFDKINNFVLMYILTTFLLLLPGLFARNVHIMARDQGMRLYSKIKTKTVTKVEKQS